MATACASSSGFSRISPACSTTCPSVQCQPPVGLRREAAARGITVSAAMMMSGARSCCRLRHRWLTSRAFCLAVAVAYSAPVAKLDLGSVSSNVGTSTCAMSGCGQWQALCRQALDWHERNDACRCGIEPSTKQNAMNNPSASGLSVACNVTPAGVASHPPQTATRGSQATRASWGLHLQVLCALQQDEAHIAGAWRATNPRSRGTPANGWPTARWHQYNRSFSDATCNAHAYYCLHDTTHALLRLTAWSQLSFTICDQLRANSSVVANGNRGPVVCLGIQRAFALNHSYHHGIRGTRSIWGVSKVPGEALDDGS
jgi:hypothetical protein